MLTLNNYDPYPYFNLIYKLRGCHTRKNKIENGWIRK